MLTKVTNQIDTLKRIQTAGSLVQPVGLVSNVFDDLWLQMEFSFDSKKSEVVIDSWFISDAFGREISLSKLSYNEVQFVSAAMAEEHERHTRLFYDELESEFYNMKNVKRFDRD